MTKEELVLMRKGLDVKEITGWTNKAIAMLLDHIDELEDEIARLKEALDQCDDEEWIG